MLFMIVRDMRTGLARVQRQTVRLMTLWILLKSMYLVRAALMSSPCYEQDEKVGK